jgi:hypothetical protein
MKSIYSIVMLALVAFVMTAQSTHAVGVIRLQNGTLVPNNLGVGALDSSGVTMLPNGTYGAYVNGAVGSKIGPVLVRDWHNGTVTASANIVVGARDNETDSNSTGNLSMLETDSELGIFLYYIYVYYDIVWWTSFLSHIKFL